MDDTPGTVARGDGDDRQIGNFTRIIHERTPDGRVLSRAIDVLSPYCGEGVVQQDAGEECDDGNETDTDGCRNTCRWPRCGDAVLSDTELCEDGNTVSADGCSALCTPDAGGRVKGVVIDLPLSPLTGTVRSNLVGGRTDADRARAVATSHPPAGDTGPAAVAVMAAGAAAGWALTRRRASR